VSARRNEEFTHYVTAHLAGFRRLAYLLCQDWQRADDLVQGAITWLYIQWSRASAVDHTDAYARTILVRDAIVRAALSGPARIGGRAWARLRDSANKTHWLIDL
jgi:DNA-directed RNA polymerase specialized sigma24 family protein